MIPTGNAAIELDSHGDVSVPSSGMYPDVTTSQDGKKGIRDNGVLVTVTCEVLREITTT